MEKQDQLFAVWLLQRGYANELTQAERFALAIRKNECTEEMLSVIGGNIDVFMNLGQPITASNLQPFLQDKFQLANKLIKFWIANPKDTNAVFFFNECRKLDIL